MKTFKRVSPLEIWAFTSAPRKMKQKASIDIFYWHASKAYKD